MIQNKAQLIARLDEARADYTAAIGQIVEDAKAAGISPKIVVGEMTLSAWMRDRSKPAGHIYFAQVRGQDAIKIGFSTAVKDRMRAIRSYWQIDVDLLGTLPGTMEDERWFHRMLDWSRDHGRRGNEFFYYAPIAGFVEIILLNADRWPFDENVRDAIADWARRAHPCHSHIEQGAPRFAAIARYFGTHAKQQREAMAA